MKQTPAFFLPVATPETQEEMYADLAKWCHRSVPNIDKRIYSITYVHDGEEWTATVGESLRGVRRRTTRSQGKKIERTQPVSDPATVLAIFHGIPFMVVTNHGIEDNVRSAWANPFMAGQPNAISYFSVPQ